MRRLDRLTVVGAAGFLLLFTAAAYYPGLMSNDSVTLFARVTGEQPWVADSPVAVTLFWWLANRVVCGPGGVFSAHLLAYTIGIGLIASALARRALPRVLLVLGLGFYPPTFGLVPTVLNDVAVLSGLCLAVGLWLHRPNVQDPRLRSAVGWAAGLAFFYGVAARHNSWSAGLVLVFMGVAELRRERAAPTSAMAFWARTAVASLLLFTGLYAVSSALNRGLASHSPNWVQTPIHDLAGISLEVGEVLVPPEAWNDGRTELTLAQIEAAFYPNRTSSLLWGDVAFATYDLEPEEVGVVLDRWRETIRDHPAAYLRKRIGFTAQLMGIGQRPQLEVYRPDRNAEALPACEDRWGGTRIRPTAVARVIDRGLTTLVRFPLIFRPWTYALLCLGVVVASWSRPGRGPFLARWIAVSGLFYAAPLALVGTATFFRYSVWLVFAGVLATLILVASWLDPTLPAFEEGAGQIERDPRSADAP